MATKESALAAARATVGLTQENLAFALDVSVSTLSRWENGLTKPLPPKRPKLANLLNVSLSELEVLLREFDERAPGRLSERPVGVGVDYDSWEDDLDRTAICLGRQEFDLAKLLLDRWVLQFRVEAVDTLGLHLYGRSLRLLGDLRQDQGLLRGPLSARQSYLKAIQVYGELGADRRVAQLELQLAVLDEMDGRLVEAAEAYRRLAIDRRLAERDRARAQLWVGTALSKHGLNAEAVSYISPAIQRFEQLEEPQDWSVAYQKLALAHRGAADLRSASGAIEVALNNRAGDAPMQRVRLDTAHAHILLSDVATVDSGLALLDAAAATSARYGMMHQLLSIKGIRHAFEDQA